MLENSKAYNGFSVNDAEAAKKFYTEVLGLKVTDIDAEWGLMSLHVGGGREILMYTKPDHTPATYTMLNFPVDDVDAVVDQLIERGVTFLRYDSEHMNQDDKGVNRGMGPTIAWFTDPAGNVLSIIEDD
ncbi:VOC family protein [Amycolatopsis suaedae]|uniref:VOC family protein n=1 Tax=Amycolatopsis suaedae TaxID=2510978 RepID=A0A4Q7JG68_9PSEU|nr:VOC family protein [Amycolatopsis suaedae]RZQ66013.1 VOC family protein [Amycolatopsis suaedae]